MKNPIGVINENMKVETTAYSSQIEPFVFCGGSYNVEMLLDRPIVRKLFIGTNKRICQDKPIILGTRISVSNIVELKYGLGWDDEKINAQYPQLSQEQIAAAIEYYKTHAKEIDAYLKEEEEID